MKGENHPKRAALRDARERAIERLTLAFVDDELTLEEYEERVDGAYRCRAEDELSKLTADLTTPTLAFADTGRDRAIVPAGSDPSLETHLASLRMLSTEEQRLGARTVAVLGNVERRGRFRIESGDVAMSVLGNVELDLRDVQLGPGVTTLHVRAVLGSVEITVSPSLLVECTGNGVLGSFSNVSHVPEERGPDESVLRITGSAVLGSVEVRTRPSSASAAKRLPSPRY